ncbi:MAG TPA: hypothetical protein VNO82_23830 [Solirubrobacteraceae bacterium]|nr:hypothetical protein [Solirubrobacteraceae bacterium]
MIPDWPPGTVAVLATAGPFAIPVSTALRVGPSEVLFALAPGRGSLARLRADPRCALTVMGEGIAVTLRGRASEAGEAAGTVALRLEVEGVDDHRTPAFEMEAGVRWRWVSEEASRRDEAVRAALRELSGDVDAI